jgi:hypothetical protein
MATNIEYRMSEEMRKALLHRVGRSDPQIRSGPANSRGIATGEQEERVARLMEAGLFEQPKRYATPMTVDALAIHRFAELLSL